MLDFVCSMQCTDGWIMSSRKKFGEILLEAGVLDQKTLDQALAVQRGTRIRIGKILEEMRVISEREIAAVLARQFGFRTVRSLIDRHFSRELLEMVPYEVAQKYQLFPVRLKARELFVAMVNPLDMEALDTISFQTGKRITPCVTTPSEIQQAIERHYGYKGPVSAEKVSSRTRLLLVEPADALRNEMSSTLSRLYEVAEARDAQEALQISRHLKPKILLVSTMLSKGTASDLLNHLRKELSLNYLPAIALSTSGSIQEEVGCLESCFSDYLTVPVHPQRLLARVSH
ncbi:MAG: hypothetical protein C0624_12910 [Desulfuromonas sp.]|nr:MAG: hypothetical protein C0624_12910 [Desulfuromonas sp.]